MPEGGPKKKINITKGGKRLNIRRNPSRASERGKRTDCCWRLHETQGDVGGPSSKDGEKVGKYERTLAAGGEKGGLLLIKQKGWGSFVSFLKEKKTGHTKKI